MFPGEDDEELNPLYENYEEEQKPLFGEEGEGENDQEDQENLTSLNAVFTDGVLDLTKVEKLLGDGLVNMSDVLQSDKSSNSDKTSALKNILETLKQLKAQGTGKKSEIDWSQNITWKPEYFDKIVQGVIEISARLATPPGTLDAESLVKAWREPRDEEKEKGLLDFYPVPIDGDIL